MARRAKKTNFKKYRSKPRYNPALDPTRQKFGPSSGRKWQPDPYDLTKDFDSQRKPGWRSRVFGTIGNHEVTASFGDGAKTQNQTFLGDGFDTSAGFWHHDHDHYGSGNGPNKNGTRRGKYTGPDA